MLPWRGVNVPEACTTQTPSFWSRQKGYSGWYDALNVVGGPAQFPETRTVLAEAVAEVAIGGWGTIISCLPGQLAYYYDECGERRMLLERKPG